MFIKNRGEPLELKFLRFLNFRMDLSEKDSNTYAALEKGYLGEKKFDKLLENLPNK
ncbi:MAG: hypothetical protein Q8934_10430 [Bacillota bacterium]|nr:hypothetical protein [Bacillota bacterium]